MAPGEPVDLVIRGGRVVADGAVVEATIAVTGERVSALLPPGAAVTARRVVDAQGAYVLPGAIDPHVHFAVFNTMVDDFESTAVGAAFGGVTTMIPFISGRDGAGLADGLDHFVDEGRRRSVVDFAMHCRLRPDPALIAQIPHAIERGVTSVKLFFAYRKRGMLFSDDLAFRVMELTAAHGGLALVHAENGWVIDHLEETFLAQGQTAPEYYLRSRPHATEGEAVARAITLAEMTGCPLYIVHLSTREGLDEIARGRARGAQVFAETCPQYLLLTDADLGRLKGLAKVAPPLRWERDCEALWRGMQQGFIQTVGSDHAPFTIADKSVGATDIFAAGFGMPGIETMAPLLLGTARDAGTPDVVQLVRVLSENAARIFGLYPRKGTIRVGSDADLVIWDAEAVTEIHARDLHSRAGYTCFEGRKVQGRVRSVFLRGRALVEDGELRQAPGYGQFLPRRPGVPTPAMV